MQEGWTVNTRSRNRKMLTNSSQPHTQNNGIYGEGKKVKIRERKVLSVKELKRFILQ